MNNCNIIINFYFGTNLKELENRINLLMNNIFIIEQRTFRNCPFISEFLA